MLSKQAKWISTKSETNNIITFSKDFSIPFEIEKATLNICGLGFYNAFVNEIQFPQPYFKPVVSDYKKRTDSFFTDKPIDSYFAYYDSYEISEFLKKGNNTLKVDVGSGYFHNTDKSVELYRDSNYGKNRLIFSIDIICKDGSSFCICSDGNEKYLVSNNASTLFFGDHFDFNQVDSPLENVVVLEDVINLKPNNCPYDYLKEIFLPKILYYQNNRGIFDFSTNHTGGLLFHVKGKKGSKLTVRFAEKLNKDGSLNLKTAVFQNGTRKSMYDVWQENTYILSGNTDFVTINFSYRCYRYVEIFSDEYFEIHDLKSLFIHTTMNQRIKINTSNQLINDIFDKYVQTQYCNFHNGFITDCPHREKSPYTGDTTVICETLLSIFDSESLLSKFLDDIIASQYNDGFIPYTAPDYACGGGLFWSYAIINIPLQLYKISGNKEYLSRAFPAITKFIEYLNKQHNGDLILKQTNPDRWFLGDWLAPEVVVSDTSFIATCCFYLSVKNYLYIAQELKTSINDKYVSLLEGIKESIINHYYDKKKHIFSKDVQGETVLGSSLQILPKEEQLLVNENIKNHYIDNGYHIDTGIVITPILFEYLSLNDMNDICYKLITQTTYPSYSYMLEDETTYSEHWSKKWILYTVDDKKEKVFDDSGLDLSHCHHMFGSVNTWIIKNVCGISLDNYKDKVIEISPKFIDEIKTVNFSIDDLQFEYDTYDSFKLNVVIPLGMTVKICLEKIKAPLKITCNNSKLEKLQISNNFILKEGSYTISMAKEKSR